MAKVSIIIPTLNSAKHLKSTLDSVKNQTMDDFDVLVIDDGSFDDTIEIIREYSKTDNRFYLLNGDRLGPGSARAKGILESRSDFIAFLDSDDIWMIDKLERQIGFMEANAISFTYTKFKTISDLGQETSQLISPKGSITFNQYFCIRGIVNSSVVVRRELFSNEILSKTQYPSEDLRWWFLILKNHCGYLAPIDGVRYRISKNSISSKNKIKNLISVWMIYTKEHSIRIPIAFIYMVMYILDVIWRRAAHKK